MAQIKQIAVRIIISYILQLNWSSETTLNSSGYYKFVLAACFLVHMSVLRILEKIYYAHKKSTASSTKKKEEENDAVFTRQNKLYLGAKSRNNE